jgi:PKD repeat protein
VLTVATYDDIQLQDKSVNAVSYQWDLGNDSTTSTQNPRFYYKKPGTYTLTLTVQNASRQAVSVSKKVKVLDRVVKQVVIVDLSDRVGSPQRHLVNPTVWAVVRLGGNRIAYSQQSASNPSFDAPIIYQSNKIAGLTAADLPYAFPVPGKLVVDFPALSYPYDAGRLGYTGVGYGLELYAQDASGTYLLSSSYLPYYQSQAGGIGTVGTDIQRNAFNAVYGDVKLVGDFE